MHLYDQPMTCSVVECVEAWRDKYPAGKTISAQVGVSPATLGEVFPERRMSDNGSR
jgi:hypothetical protein